ncbi:MAG TPA: type II secretion system protein GspN, partial [Nitrospirota bacterium]|nr:type II secretion system protein GspN [Nitrospirota bacterium]
MIDKKLLVRRALFVVYFVVVFLIFLVLLFPFERIKERLESEIHQRTPFELNIARVYPIFLNQFVLSDVVLSDRNGKVVFESQQVRTSISLFGLLHNLLSVDMKARAYGGELLMKAQQGSGRQYVLLDASGLDIGSYPVFKDA